MMQRKILIVEDVSVVAEAYKGILERASYVVLPIARSCSEAIRIATAEKPDCAIMDIELVDGELAGLDAAGILHETMSVPIVFITGNDESLVENSRLRRFRPLWFLAKPVTDRQLLAHVRLALGPLHITRIFVCYSHHDTGHLEELETHLSALESHQIDLWSDRRIEVGKDWGAEILRAMEASDVAIFLLSANFQNSHFIQLAERPFLLKKARVKGTTIVPVVVEHVALHPELRSLQTFKQSSIPGGLRRGPRQKFWAEFVTHLQSVLKSR